MSVRELGNRSTRKPREDCLLSSAPEEEITADGMSIRPTLLILSKQSESLSGTDNWLKEKLINQGNTTYNVCTVMKTIMTLMDYGLWSDIKSLPKIPVNCWNIKSAVGSHHYYSKAL